MTRRNTPERTVYIAVDIPSGCDSDDVAQFAIDALSGWGNKFHPDDPLFHSLRVKWIHTASKNYILNEEGTDLACRSLPAVPSTLPKNNLTP